MKVNVALNTKSIKEAIKQIRAVQNKFNTMVSDYLQRSCEWIRKEADIRLQNSGVGDIVISDIINSSTISVSGNTAKLSYGEKAVYIEFGVGIVGEQSPHPQATQAGYEYDVESGKKNADRSWSFVANIDGTADIKNKNMIRISNIGHGGAKQLITTKGNEASLFLYQSSMDFKSTGAYKKLWQDVKRKYIK